MGDRTEMDARWISKDDPQAAPFVKAEAARVRDGQEGARERGREVLTPAGARRLFNVTLGDVRMARVRKNVNAPLVLDVTGKPLHFLDLLDALEYWSNRKRSDFDAMLQSMRGSGFLVGLDDGRMFSVLHDRPLVRIEDAVPGQSEHHRNIE